MFRQKLNCPSGRLERWSNIFGDAKPMFFWTQITIAHPLTRVSQTWAEVWRRSRIQGPIKGKKTWGFWSPCIFCIRYHAHQEKTSSDKTSSKRTLQRSSWTVQKPIMCLNSFKCLPEQQNCKKNDASVLGISNQHDLGCSCHFSWACIFPRTSEVDCGQPQTLHQYIPQQCVPSQLKIF